MPRPEGPCAPRPDVIDNPGSQRVTRVAALARRGMRTRHGRFLVEGPQGVREAVTHVPGHVRDLYVTEAAAQRHADVLAEARDASLYTHRVTDQVMAAMSTDAQGLLAVVSTEVLTPAARLDEVLAGARLVAVLTEAQDPGNAGTIIRAADAAGADAVVLARGSVEATNPKVVRATAGSLFHLPVISGLDLTEVVEALHEAGLTVLAADARGDNDLFGADALLARPGAWLLGNEARGLGPEALSQADAVVAIPVFGAAESLNVSAAAAVCLYASARAQHAG
ncbi:MULTISPECIES: RNA methyltransferase [unclassified Actinomyces]|uniref:TrmH family RNA methyltransferase n=1 Tax=unclassified Actinomyces TaxID=2609248 RepID=UPI002018214B|nr:MULTISPECIES: RNA methyltransferase [unclassified Actinomyces]MCL3778594.1 RNA methyltransferase [Actinomyces sp. AC-20-1]MCL3789108.1 RNA methyltransferase [Actinomyces sp. 187325]MCL3794053.1 RNA methyltransferase [Actinomyces sp. 217892]